MPELLEVHVPRRRRGRVVEATGRADVEAGDVAQLAGRRRVVHRGERDDLPSGRALGYPSAGAVSVHDRFLRSRAPTGCLADRGTTPAVGTVSIREECAASGDALRHHHARAGRHADARGPRTAWRGARRPRFGGGRGIRYPCRSRRPLVVVRTHCVDHSCGVDRSLAKASARAGVTKTSRSIQGPSSAQLRRSSFLLFDAQTSQRSEAVPRSRGAR